MTHHEPELNLTPAIEELDIPAGVIDREGRIRWLNRGAIAIVGDRIGEPFVRMVAPEDLHIVRTNFAKKLIGEAESTEYNLTLLGRDGRRIRTRVFSVPLWEANEIVGTFGLAYPRGGRYDGPKADADVPELTARQHEVLALLADGLGTEEIASRLGVAEETARNHIRALFRQLDVHSRLEAVVRAYRLGLLQPRRDG